MKFPPFTRGKRTGAPPTGGAHTAVETSEIRQPLLGALVYEGLRLLL